jgi:hypothetical protein
MEKSWNAVVDVSNVCWSPYLPPLGQQAPVWERLTLVMSAWRELYAEARFELVADESLVRVLGPDARRFLELKREGSIVTAAVADDEILRLARDGGLHVITRDHYTDHRAAHPWIERSPERFHAWDTTADGVVRFTPLGIKTRALQDVSQAREVKRIRFSAKLDARNQAHRKILQTRWECPNTSCRQNAQWQGQLLAWPRISPEGAAVCPSCTRPLVSLGPRAALHEVVVAELESQAEIARFPLEVDCPVIVGRGAAVKGIDLAMYTAGRRSTIDTVSRLHLMLRLQHAGSGNMRLSVLDLNSTNGTMVQRWTGSSFDPARGVPPEQEIHLGTKDRVVLGETVLVRLSGKKYLAEPTSPHPEVHREDAEPGVTTVVRQPAAPGSAG